MSGYLAYNNSQPIGWCNVNNRQKYQRLLKYQNHLFDHVNEKVCSIVCFVIHPNYRRKGVASQLLEAICRDYSGKNYDYIEAYPRKGESNESNFKGPLGLYERFDFQINKEYDEYYVMKKKLK